MMNSLIPFIKPSGMAAATAVHVGGLRRNAMLSSRSLTIIKFLHLVNRLLVVFVGMAFSFLELSLLVMSVLIICTSE